MEDRKMLAALLGGALIGALVGAASATVFGSTRAAEAPGAGASGIEDELRALRQALDRATARFGELATSGSPVDLAQPAALPREPVSGALDAAALLAGVDERLDRLERILTRGATTSGPGQMPQHPGTATFPAADVRTSRAFRDRHLFLGYTEVAELYGLPDRSHVRENCVRWTYDVDDGEEWFDFVDGRVVSTRADYY